MEPLGLLYGVLAYTGAIKILTSVKKPMKKMAVVATSQMFNALDSVKEAAYNAKEGFEDIIAEAQYENMKKHQKLHVDINSNDANFEDGGI